MRKTFQLNLEGKQRDRLLDAARHDIHRYLRRERRRAPPAGFDTWAFDCRFGASQADAQPVAVEDIKSRIDEAAGSGAAQFYVEILARPALRSERPAGGQGSGADGVDDASDGADGSDGGGDGD
ncbi:DUF6172 family protein [Paracidovorax wautersii]|uniref:Uncharacterized protein n=1 Tax=Paracidovorax wautersii TaxID=1177982 RepID=A0ABU1IFT2_9BURK|nr:DUF6172 family protein [Paracidovorax wautersii]MDR6216079.1 hypothetical protein [Paracidovorax wautersii]